MIFIPSYGDEGYQIMILTLRHMFPEQSFNLEIVAPLPWTTAIQEFLLPEVAVYLIQDDLHVLRPAAIETLHKSRIFGTLMHSMDHESSAVDDVVRKLGGQTRVNAVTNTTVQDHTHTPEVEEVQEAVVKNEQKETLLRKLQCEHEVIDLTLDDD
jgi:hypothetical protein